MNKKDCIEIGQIGCSLVWVSKDNKKIWRYDIDEKKMYRGNFKIYCKKYLQFFIKHWDKFSMFHKQLINAKDQYKTTSLMWASYYNNTKLVKLLIEKGVNVNAENKNNDTALIYISHIKNNLKLAKLLIEKGANVNIQTKFGYTALLWASIYNSKLAKLLIENGANIKIKDSDGDNALILASNFNNIESAKLFIEKGIDVNEKNNYGETALTFAYRNDNTKLIILLLEKGAK